MNPLYSVVVKVNSKVCIRVFVLTMVSKQKQDHRVYIWSRDHEALLEELEGHENTVNCVSWCPVEPMQFVSASDDHTIRV